MNLPEAIVLQCELGAEDLFAFGSVAATVLQEIGFPELVGWYWAGYGPLHHQGIEAALKEIQKQKGPHHPSITLLFPHESTVNLSFNAHTKLGMVRADIAPESPNEAAICDVVGKLITYLERLLVSGNMANGAIWRQGGGADQLPSVPLVYPSAYAVVVTEAMVKEEYDDVDGFWTSGWHQRTIYGENNLLIRAVNAASGAKFLALVQDQQRALARIAKAGRTIYGWTESTDKEELVIYHSGPARLRVTTYLDDKRTLVLTCTLESGEHVQGWEIDRLYEILAVKELEDGRSVEAIRVIFPDQASALREKRPLLDVGADVQHMDQQGNLVSIYE